MIDQVLHDAGGTLLWNVMCDEVVSRWGKRQRTHSSDKPIALRISALVNLPPEYMSKTDSYVRLPEVEAAQAAAWRPSPGAAGSALVPNGEHCRSA